MNKYLKYIICCLLPLTAVSCFKEDIVEQLGNDDIVLTFDGAAMTKAADTEAEAYVSHVDVLIFDASEAMYHHERVGNGGRTTFTLAKRRSDFPAGTQFYVYLIANSSAEAQTMAALADVEDLKHLVQKDNEIMFANIGEARHSFLMDAVAYSGSEEPQTPGTVELNDGVAVNSTYLKAVFRRAAAKVQVVVNKGGDVTFADAENSAAAAYYLRNCPVSTTVIDGYDINPDLVTPSPAPQNNNFVFGTDRITVAAYAYEYEWKDQSVQDKEVSLVVNIPMVVDNGGTAELRSNNWYKIPVSKDSRFERNHIYTVTVTVNALGATSKDTPQTLDDITYAVEPWENVGIEVGNEDNRPAYLQLNTNHVDMYNVNEDSSTLEFASSSEIAADGITLIEAYYYDYLDRKQSVTDLGITATAEQGVLNGNITIYSPFVGMTAEERQDAISNLTRPEFSETAPVEPEGKPAEVPNPGNQAENPDTDAVLNQIAQQYSSEGWWIIPGVTVTWSRDGEGNVTFSDGADWSDAAENAQEEYERRLYIYNNYEQAKQAYEAYLAALEAWNTQNASYLAELELYNQKYAAYQSALTDYNNKVAAINNAEGDTHENAIRYMTFEVRNKTGQTERFTVAQYPTIYITNERGHYSYRSDFGDTYYGHKGDPNRSGANWEGGNNESTMWSYSNTAGQSVFFGSKVATGSEGNYSINYAYYGNNSDNPSVNAINGLDNPRMYHVHVTATSSQYIVAVPRLEGGYTESSEDNSKLVSPSFMIASQLGATMTPSGGFEQAKRHCEQYIEVTAVDYDGDGKPEIYDDWRLPTAAEIDIIIQHQDISDAMAVVLTGQAYYCSWNGVNNRGEVQYLKTTGKSGGQNAVRCIRDAY